MAVSTQGGAWYLTKFVWPFDLERHACLATAIDVARHHRVTVDQAPASTWIFEQLAHPVDHGVPTIIWQSIIALSGRPMSVRQ